MTTQQEQSNGHAAATRPGFGTATAVVPEAPQAVYARVTDVAGMGRWSPECVGADGVGGAGLVLGDVFTGRNERGGNTWTTTCTVQAAVPGLAFRFAAGDGEDATTWTYTFRDLGDGSTEVAESFDAPALRPGVPDGSEEAQQLAARTAQLQQDLLTTLAALGSAAGRDGRG